MTQDMKKDMILHTKGKRLVRNGRTHVRLGAHCSSLRGALRSMLLLLLTLVTITAWGQATLSEGDGYYYIVNNNTNAYVLDASTNWYMVPASNGGDNVNLNKWAWNNDVNTPLVTTYQTNKDDNSVWIVFKSGDYYYFKHKVSGRYMTLNAGVGNNSNRRTFHMETTSNPGDAALFKLTSHTGTPTPYSINPKNISTGNMYLNPSNGNKDKYYAHYTTDGGYDVGGTIGLYNKNATADPGSKWNFEFIRKCVTPEIRVSADGVVTITSVTPNATIYYTTNGDTPDNTSTPYNGEGGTGSFTISGTTTMKAIAIKDDFTESDVAEQLFEQTAAPTIDQTNCDNTVAINCTAPEATIIYTTDNTEPTLINKIIYTGPFTPETGATIRAKAYVDGVSFMSSEATPISSYTPAFTTAPTITIGSDYTVTISGSGEIYYTINGSDPTVGDNDQKYDANNKPTLLEGSGLNIIKAIAKDGSLAASCITTKEFVVAIIIDTLEKLAEIANTSYSYKLTTNIDASNLNASISGFTGTLDGNYYTISNLKMPLFTNLTDGTVKNVKFSGVDITTGINVGAICDEAGGTTKIFNCGVLSGSVSGTNAGGLVGHIKSGTSSKVRVVNCYNYGDVSGTGYAAGIVGWNEGTVGPVRIALCMMYGTVSGATTISPVYAGTHTSNAQNFTEYNYYLYSTEKNDAGQRVIRIPYTAYNDQLAIDKEEYLTRFPFYRHILNTHRELAAYFLFANNTTEGEVTDITAAQVDEIGHWAVKKGDDAHKYPIIEIWEKNRKSTPTETKNDLPNTTADYAGKLLTSMGNSGYLNVSINIGDNNYSARLPITDMDTLRYDYTYGKVILPFANEYEINSDYSKICTGWKITGVSDGSTGSFANYNFADRNCTAKDIYNENTNPFIYAQGGYYVVPTGVTGIEITANFATAYYLSDQTYEIGYNSSYGGRTGKGGDVPAFHGRTPYNTLTDAVNALEITTNNPHKQAIVLVGNYHYNLATKDIATEKGFTLMSIDADNNQEPDYGFYSIGPERPQMPALRFDFVPIISLGMAAKVNGSNYYPGVPIWKPRGWYEQTETTVSFMNQFELDSGNFLQDEKDVNYKGKGQNPCIINGGYFVQMIRSNKTDCSKASYFKIGGNAYIKEFYPGAHSGTNAKTTTTIVPVNVTGGQVDECFMTGYRSGGKAIGSDIRFWCSGGKIGKFLGAYMDKPMQTSGTVGNVNMTAKIDHALIGSFFGGGTSQNATITGDINVTINNSKVDFYCGGPEFGDMSSGKVVITTANNTKFGEYYGAGFGGTSITYSPVDGNPNIGANVSFPSDSYTFNSSTVGRLTSSGSLGLATCYKFEYLMHSFDKTKLVARFITGYADFNLATTGSVINNLTGCTVEKDFYGAGCQGKVAGTVTSTLTDCTIKRNAFGGGYQATSNEVKVYPPDAPTLSVYNGVTGIFSEFGTTDPETFTWEQGDEDNPTADDANNKLKTSNKVTMADLGNVTGDIYITINGGYVGGTDEGESPAIAVTATTGAIPAGGSVYGGGNESKSLSNTTLTLKGNAQIYGNVFGGGNEAGVTGSTTVNIEE